MATFKFNLHDRVRRIGQAKTYTVEECREIENGENKYRIQMGTDFASREWAKESELEAAE